MKKWFRLFVATVAALSTAMAHAENYEEDLNFIYRDRSWAEALSTEEGLTLLGEYAQRAMVSILEAGVQNNLFPRQINSLTDLEQWRRGQDRIGDMVKYLNAFVTEQRRRPGRFSLPDMVPDAIMVFGGGGMSLSFLGSVGGSVTLGLVIMPVVVQKYCKTANPAVGCSRGGEMVAQYPSVRLSVVAMPTIEQGVGVGASGGPIGGLGFIWDLNDAFVRPDQFWGMGGGLNANVAIGPGIGARVGVVTNWELPGFVDFAYAMAFVQGGGLEISGRWHATPFINGPALAGMIDSTARKSFEQMLKDAEKRMTDQFRDMINGPLSDRIRALIQSELHGTPPAAPAENRPNQTPRER